MNILLSEASAVVDMGGGTHMWVRSLCYTGDAAGPASCGSTLDADRRRWTRRLGMCLGPSSCLSCHTCNALASVWSHKAYSCWSKMSRCADLDGVSRMTGLNPSEMVIYRGPREDVQKRDPLGWILRPDDIRLETFLWGINHSSDSAGRSLPE